MADDTRPENDREATETERVVLKLAAEEGTPGPQDGGELWEVVGTYKDKSKKAAIEQYAGKEGSKHPGTYRAPSLRAWREFHAWREPDQQRLDHLTGD